MADLKKQMSTSALKRRVSDMELELSAAQRTIEALLDRVERRAESEPLNAALFEAAARLEHEVERRTREALENREALESANAELRALSSSLDKVVRSRTRALIESERQLQKHVEQLNRVSEERREFIAIAAHELRTPLTSLLGYSELIAEGQSGTLDPKMKGPFEQIRRAAARLRKLVEEMLDVSRIDAGEIALRSAPISLRDTVLAAAQKLRPVAEARQLTLRVSAEADGLVVADADRLSQLVQNLMANAIKLGRATSTVSIEVDVPPAERYNDLWMRLRVTRAGGPESSQKERSFEPFAVSSVEHHTSDAPDSAGLGLFIARRLVELHGGVVAIDVDDSGAEPTTTITVLLRAPGA